ncbi:MAG: DUF2147 domain-containing protein [Flavobacteriales bacterium]|nr:DUF2147 domain-containing protein [Flavobacteriales bacterium]
MKKHSVSIYKVFALSFFLVISLLGFTQTSADIFGKWVTIDDKTGKERSEVEIYKVADKAFGRITRFIENPEKETTERCDECDEDDDRKDQLVLGMEIIRDMELDGDRWEDGTILDPEEGKVYSCKIWQEDGKLKVRGYIAFFYRTQEWIKKN